MAMNLVKLIDRYNSDDTCRTALERLRWPSVACLRCGDMDVNDLGKHNRWECRSCRYQFSDGGHYHARFSPSAPQVVPGYLPHVASPRRA